MIPVRTNLLSPQKAQYHKRVVYIEFAKSTLEILLIVVSITGAALLFGSMLLQNTFTDISGGTIVRESKYVQADRQITAINTTIREVNTLQKKYTLWTPLMTDISNVIPESIIIHRLDLYARDKEFVISGEAPTRDDVLFLKEQLLSVPWIISADIPLSQLIEKTNIVFTISGKMQN